MFEGEEVAQMIGAAGYHECTLKTGEGVRELFEHAVRLSIMKHIMKPKDKSSFRERFSFLGLRT
jgi:Ras homolog gene family, member A